MSLDAQSFARDISMPHVKHTHVENYSSLGRLTILSIARC